MAFVYAGRSRGSEHLMESGADLLIVGVDGLDFDVVRRLGPRVPTLQKIVAGSEPHGSVFPPDSVPSWTSIVTGLEPERHGQLSNVKFFLEDADESSVTADLNGFIDDCFWEAARGDVAVINPFLAFPPWAPGGHGAMVSGPPFSEQAPEIVDPRGLLVGVPPRRMGGFARIPERRDLLAFSEEALTVGAEQYEYALSQLGARRWDLFFNTSLVIDRLEHYTWEAFDRGGSALSEIIPRAHEQLDQFLAQALSLQDEAQKLVLLSDHGHGPRASIGVNLQEFLRRQGHFRVSRASSSTKKRAIEWTKTMVYSLAPRLHLEDAAIRLARRLPAKRQLKSGTYVGTPDSGAVSVPDLAGTNPFGGITVAENTDVDALIAELMAMRYRGSAVFRWIDRAARILPTQDSSPLYPDLLFEMEPQFGPTWNLYGPIFAPVITRRRQSGGHTRRAVYAEYPPVPVWPADSLAVNARLRALVGELARTEHDGQDS